MLINAKTLNTYVIDSLDTTIENISELYFDEQHWSIRYFVAERGSWLNRRRILISAPLASQKDGDDPRLRSTRDVIGSFLHGIDGEIGKIEDFIIDDITWRIRYLVVNAKYWWLGKNILITREWINHLNWISNEKLFVNLSTEIVQLPTELDAEPETEPETETLLTRHTDFHSGISSSRHYSEGIRTSRAARTITTPAIPPHRYETNFPIAPSIPSVSSVRIVTS